MPTYTVRQGDTTSSIAYVHGLFWETIWNHPNNSELKAARDNPNVLLQGDMIFIPDKEQKEVPATSEQKHVFRRKGVPEHLRLQLLDDDHEPRPNVTYRLDIDGRLFNGTSDSEGIIEQSIPPNSQRGRLVITETEEEHELNLGHLDPIDELSGIQARLNNLEIYYGEINGQMDDATVLAIKEFQTKYELEESEEIDEATRAQLEEVHGF